jgi:hypothetical protein
VAAVATSNGTFLERFNVNGSLDVTFGGTGMVPTATGPLSETEPTDSVNSVLVQPDGRIVSVSDILARFNPNGTPDSTFGSDGVSRTGLYTTTGLLQPDGKIVVSGTVTTLLPPPQLLTMSWFAGRYLGDTPAPTASERFVAQVYLDLLQRPADDVGLSYWSGLIDNGQATAAQVAQMIEGSPEYHQVVIEQFYAEYLHRAADSDGLTGWENFLAGGGTSDEMRTMILGSQEYFNLNGGANDTFVTALYRDLLLRQPDPAGALGWDAELMTGTDRTTIASRILRSAEGTADEVKQLYFWLLHRAADSVGLQSFSNQLEQGRPVERIVATIAGSPEYAATRT